MSLSVKGIDGEMSVGEMSVDEVSVEDRSQCREKYVTARYEVSSSYNNTGRTLNCLARGAG